MIIITQIAFYTNFGILKFLITLKNHLIRGLKFYLRIFTEFLRSGANNAYHSYEKPLRTANSKKFKWHLTPIYIFLGPVKALFVITHKPPTEPKRKKKNCFFKQ